jgi:glutamate-ammonia-ligase adenylyltransferase
LDTRLRPEGSKGALASPVEAFVRYLSTRAETWERMAWTRHRFLAGDPEVAAEAAPAITGFVFGRWDPGIPGYARHVRTRMEQELAREDDRRVDFKVGRGGLADIDFALQLVQIREGREQPHFRLSGSRRLLAARPATTFIEDAEWTTLGGAHAFLRRLETVARIVADAGVGGMSTDPEPLELLGSLLELPSPAGESLLRRYREVTAEVRAIYERILERLDG